MKVLIFHVTLRRSGARGRKGEVKEVERLTVGRGTDNALHVPGLTVALHHCAFVKRPDGVAIEPLDARDLRVNGGVTSGQLVKSGDIVAVGQWSLRVLDTESSAEDLILELEQTSPGTTGVLHATARIGVERGFVSRRTFSWLAASFILLLGLALPLVERALDPDASGVHPRPPASNLLGTVARAVEKAWTSGPLSRNHSHLESDCGACHVGGFVRVRNQECTACHATIGRHTPVALGALDSMRCADCHAEHSGDAGLLQAGMERCVSCHRDLRRQLEKPQLLDVSSFRAGHPEFRPAVVVDPISAAREHVSLADIRNAKRESPIRERSGLAFSHAAHLAPGIAGPEGEPADLGCGDCHVPDAGRALLQPIEFERHCRSCHGLQFERGNERQAPHEDAKTVRTALVEFYSSLALGAGPPVRRKDSPAPGDRAGAKAWVDEKVAGAERRLLGASGVCALCHTFQGAGDAVDVVPVVLPPGPKAARWFPLANFDHGPHEVAACISCHDVAKAEDAGAIALPGLARCRDCHGDAGGSGRAGADGGARRVGRSRAGSCGTDRQRLRRGRHGAFCQPRRHRHRGLRGASLGRDRRGEGRLAARPGTAFARGVDHRLDPRRTARRGFRALREARGLKSGSLACHKEKGERGSGA